MELAAGAQPGIGRGPTGRAPHERVGVKATACRVCACVLPKDYITPHSDFFKQHRPLTAACFPLFRRPSAAARSHSHGQPDVPELPGPDRSQPAPLAHRGVPAREPHRRDCDQLVWRATKLEPAHLRPLATPRTAEARPFPSPRHPTRAPWQLTRTSSPRCPSTSRSRTCRPMTRTSPSPTRRAPRRTRSTPSTGMRPPSSWRSRASSSTSRTSTSGLRRFLA